MYDEDEQSKIITPSQKFNFSFFLNFIFNQIILTRKGNELKIKYMNVLLYLNKIKNQKLIRKKKHVYINSIQ